MCSKTRDQNITQGEMSKPTSGIIKCCVFVERVPTDILYASEFSAGIYNNLKYRKKGRKYGKKERDKKYVREQRSSVTPSNLNTTWQRSSGRLTCILKSS